MCSGNPDDSSLPGSRCGRPQCMGSQEAWLESVVLPSTAISLRGDLFGQALGPRHSEMPKTQRCGCNVV
jgi:hypothetical protein